MKLDDLKLCTVETPTNKTSTTLAMLCLIFERVGENKIDKFVSVADFWFKMTQEDVISPNPPTF